jgi:D-aspartate ligase
MGLGFSGIGALHSLQEMSPRPDPIIGIDHNPKEIGYSSRVGPMLVAPPPWEEDGESLRQYLLDLARRYARTFVLYPCGDDYVRFLSRNRQSLSPRFSFLMPDAPTLDLLMNKSTFADLARSLGVSAPPSTLAEAVPGLVLPAGMRFPVVAKAITSFKDDPFWGIIRVRQFDSVEAWNSFFEAQQRPGCRLMIQELVVGGETCQYVYEGLWSPDAEEVLAFTIQKIRQQPPRYGSSSRAVSRLDPEVLEQSRILLNAVRYRGLVDIDFKRDERDGRLRVLEINPRLGGIHRVGRSCGIELVQAAYRMACGDRVPRAVQAPGRVGHWCHFSKDLQGLLPQLRKRPGLIFPWLVSYLRLPMDAIFSWRDPGPWAAALRRLFLAVVRELRTGGWKEERI